MDLSFRIQALQRPEGGREGLFEHLVEVVEKAVAGNGAPPVVVVVRGEVVELVPVQPVIDARIPAGRFLAALSRSRVDDGPHPDAVGLMGRFLLRRRRPDGSPEGPGVPMVQVFLEWPDNAWLHWRALLDPDGAMVPDSATRWAAVLGDPLPDRLGRWWSTGRREGLGLALRRRPPSAEPLTAPMVH